MADLGERSFGVISEGERQQVLLARALMSNPEMILLDEPFAGLDLGARERLLVHLAALAADPASPPLVLVTHHCEEIPPGFTHAGLVSAGRLMATGAARRGHHLRERLGLFRDPGHGRLHRGQVVGSRALNARKMRTLLIHPRVVGTNEGSGGVPTRSALCISPTIHHLERAFY